ncbi:MAG: acyl carrier protein [Pseudomonadota bacterium]
MSDQPSVSDRLTELIAKNTKLAAEDINTDLNLENSGLDSFARIELILVIEETFDIEFDDSESANIATVGDIVNLIESKIA